MRLAPPYAAALAGAAAAAAAGVAAVVVVWRALAAGRRTTPTPPEDAHVDSFLAECLANRDSIAAALAGAITYRTISFEDRDGNAASLLEAGDGGSGDSAPAGAPRRGCGCCNADRPAVPSPPPAAAAGDAAAVATPESLAASRAAFDGLYAHLARCFPRVHAALEVHVVNRFSRVLVWRGTAHATAAPIAFAAHTDVVPVPDAAEWAHPPFGGVIADGCVWGRGAIDDKQSVVGLLAAVEALLARGFAPRRTVALLLGHDEELGGPDGAAAIARALPAIMAGAPRFEWLLDEGLFLLRDYFPGVAKPVAVVCVGEKGHVNVELRVAQPAGHSSVPPPTTAIGILARAVARLEAAPFPAHMAPADGLFDALLPHMRLWPHRLLFANRWLFAPLLARMMLADPRSAALLRTTTAVTLAGGGVKSNVLPPLATAVVNHRIHPADSVAGVLARDAAVIADTRVALRALEPLEPAPVSSTASRGYALIGDAVRAVFGRGAGGGDVAVAPGLMLGNTDTKHFWGAAGDIYRHCPTQLDGEGVRMFHGRDERIGVENLARIAAFYGALVLMADRQAGGGGGGGAA